MAVDLAIIGGQRSGKTTWLGALARALDTERVEFFRASTDLAPDQRVLSQLKAAIIGKKYPQRTNAAEAQSIEFRLDVTDASLGVERVHLEAFDHTGEDLTILFESREGWSDAWRRRARARGLVIFLRAHRDSTIPLPVLRPPPRSNPLDPEITNTFGTAGARVESGPESFERDPSERLKVPTEIELIETLQFMHHERGLGPGERETGPDRQRVSVVLSAWDAVDQSASPRATFEKEYALLAQFLWSNHRYEDVMVFGVSATGCDLNTLEPKTRPPPGFVKWVDTLENSRESHDLSLPLAFSLFGMAALSPR